MPQPGRIVILNGAPRAGKSTLARAIQLRTPGNWINWGVDAFNAILPPDLFPGIGLRPGGERPDLEPQMRRLYSVYADALVVFARAGLDVVADLGLHRDYADPFDPLAVLMEGLSGLPVTMIAVDCDLDVIMSRRNADPDIYVVGPGVPPPVLSWQTEVHRHWRYDLRLDMARLQPDEAAEIVSRHLRHAQILGLNSS
jgi:chloramphenicol 3-O phosphotransferase